VDGFTDYLNVGCHVNNIMHHMFLLKGWLSFVHRRTHKMVAVLSLSAIHNMHTKYHEISNNYVEFSMDAKG
jgi:tRNA splicing ligase